MNDSLTDTPKLIDVKQFVQKNNPHVFGIVESDLHGLNSTRINRKKFSTEEIQRKLHISGYSLLLPSSWQSYGIARVIVYIKEDVHYKTIKVNPEDDDLQSLAIEIGLGRERKTVYNLFYREWTGGVSQLDNQASQLDRQARQVAHWMTLNHSRKKDIVIMGDANICARKWNDDSSDPQKKQIANLTQEFLLEETFVQLVSKDTRSELFQGAVQSCLIGHIYTNSPGKCENTYSSWCLKQ